MKFEAPKFEEAKNPNIPHDVNNLREFRSLLGYLIAGLVLLWALVESLIWVIPRTISIELERQWLGGVGQVLQSADNSRQDPNIQVLADMLAERMGLPENSITVYINSQSIPNAYATFGGNIVIFQGILDKLADEESVAALLAHEIAHIKHRDPLRSMSRTLLYSLIAAAFGSDSQLHLLANLDGMRHSRELERAADQAAVHSVVAHYGNAGGVLSLFEMLKSLEQEMVGDENGKKKLPTSWLSTHPDTAERLNDVKRLAQEYNYAMKPPTLPNIWRKTPINP